MSEVLVNGEVPVVRNDAENNRYVVEVAGERLGLIDYTVSEGVISLNHTEVDQDKSVPGLAKLLVTSALDDVRAQGKAALPVCPYVRRTIDKDRERFLDLVPEDQRARFELD